jgi:Tol biopolymer transport system component
MDLYQKAVTGSEPERQILKSDKRKIPADWSHDGRFLLFEQADPKTNWDLWALPMAGDRTTFPILQSEFNEIQGVLSPDGRWVAYSSDEAGGYQVYVQPFAGPSLTAGSGQRSGAKWRISTDGGVQPRWRSDGKELFYLSAEMKIMSVAVKTVPAFEAGKPLPLFTPTIPQNFTNVQFDVTPDGKRFLVSAPPNERGSAPTTVVLNWTAGLKP